MHFLFQGLHALMQQLVHLPAEERPRVPTIWDEGGYIASMNTVKQAATHREAGLEVVMGIQYLSQLGAKAESAAITEAIRKGVTNLFQSFCLFRVGDPDDAEAATRVAMSIYQTMIRSDIESRELMGVTPEQALYLSVWLCLASWISGGARAARFYGQTYPFVKLRNGAWAQHHLRVSRKRPARTPSNYRRPISAPGAAWERSRSSSWRSPRRAPPKRRRPRGGAPPRAGSMSVALPDRAQSPSPNAAKRPPRSATRPRRRGRRRACLSPTSRSR